MDWEGGPRVRLCGWQCSEPEGRAGRWTSPGTGLARDSPTGLQFGQVCEWNWQNLVTSLGLMGREELGIGFQSCRTAICQEDGLWHS